MFSCGRKARFVAALLFALPFAAHAQSFTPAQRAEIVGIVRDALKSDPSILRDAIDSLQADDAQKEQAAAKAAIGTLGPALTQDSGDQVAGNPRGDVTVVEFYDLRCPYCRRMLPTMAALLSQDRGVRLVYKDIPILGAGSVLGAKAVLAARAQGGYLALHDALMTGPSELTEATLRQAVEKAGLDWERLSRDMQASAIQSHIDANLALARKLDIRGTPGYVIGDRLIAGAVDLSELKAAITEQRQKAAGKS
jgi:protein-disulfide isomerase